MNHVLVLARSAHQAIEQDCLQHAATETGGVLQGRLMGTEFIVPFTIPAGPRARKTSVQFSPDSDWQQVLLDYLHARFRADYVGDWHKHPAQLDRPSRHDLNTARTIVRTWPCALALFPIAVVEAGCVRLRAYLMRRDTAKFEEVAIEVAADNDPRVVAVLTGQDLLQQGDNRVESDDARGNP